mgnify:CR=1 FL=1
MNMKHVFGGIALAFTVGSSAVLAAPSAGEVAKLGVSGTELTPNGAIRAGNAEGTIPEWTGGITEVPDGFEWPNYVNPYKDDEILFTITADNYQDYEDKLTDGQVKMFETYPETFKMNIYPTRRSWSAPDWVYDKTIKHAADTTLDSNGDDPVNHWGGGLCFPLPQNGAEARLNMDPRRCNYYGKRENVWYNHTLVDQSGSTQTTAIQYWNYKPMDAKGAPPPDRDSEAYDPNWYVMFQTFAPPRQAGQGILFIADINYDAPSGGEDTWIYNPGQRRVLRSPQVKYDFPFPGSNGMLTTDQAFTGTQGDINRYNYEMKAKREVFVPYNSYQLADRGLSEEDVIGENHISPELLRYELHRVIPVVATLKDEFTHIYSKRVFYADEDSFWNMATDLYDQEGNLWRYEENYTMNFYDYPLFHRLMEGKYDFRSGYVVELLDVEEPAQPRSFNDRAGDFKADFYGIGNLKSMGIR